MKYIAAIITVLGLAGCNIGTREVVDLNRAYIRFLEDCKMSSLQQETLEQGGVRIYATKCERKQIKEQN